MTFVIRCYDKNGQITFDSTVRTIRKMLAIRTQSNVAGTLDLAPYAGMKLDICLMPAENPGLSPVPLVVIEGNTLRWSQAPVSCFLMLGVSS
ncbi:hypothetical protein ACUHOO_000780 [Pseudomonas aeruginosa]|jgi:hypothetical protein|uniref:hypothetical protein n=1 Tax=Pseudomonas aeruginosa TaxID=287 RepID=UPI0003608C38|nr:hypothetical protein [Pseudomonas aeruginosa]EIU3316470.1 hypothetical protein [Pseudomonas aeruginosa]EIY2512139.1 hypothetical protein [Pseudomonas aeruginosa]EIY2820311.1 hypothetical protein [Pseudomonas aeruginosa]EKT8668869.1 hypothetical protein [Pseudomonas aeruginosa]EKU2957362.1 hypothetical protein [Pseudomonas aeruginosa]